MALPTQNLVTGKTYNVSFSIKNTGNVKLLGVKLRLYFYQNINPDTGTPNIVFTSQNYATWDTFITNLEVGASATPAIPMAAPVPKGIPDGIYFYVFGAELTSAEAGTGYYESEHGQANVLTPVMTISITDVTVT